MKRISFIVLAASLLLVPPAIAQETPRMGGVLSRRSASRPRSIFQ